MGLVTGDCPHRCPCSTATIPGDSPWSVAKQSMMSMFSQSASTSWRVPSSGRTAARPFPRRPRSSWLRNRWCGATSHVTGIPFCLAALMRRIWGSRGQWGTHRAPRCTPEPALALLTSSLRATWQMCTGRWYSWATISTAATVCRSACATMGRCRGHCSRCWGERGWWAPGPGADLPWASPRPPAHLHPQRHVVHPQAGEGVVQVHLEPSSCPSQGAQSASIVQGSPQEESKIAAGPSLSQLQHKRRWVLWWDQPRHQQRAQRGQ